MTHAEVCSLYGRLVAVANEHRSTLPLPLRDVLRDAQMAVLELAQERQKDEPEPPKQPYNPRPYWGE